MQNCRYKEGFGTLLCLLIMGLAATAFSAQSVDNSLYAGLLKKYVDRGVVDYSGFKDEEDVLDRYLHHLSVVDSKLLSRNEQFAFFINAYNAWTIKLILSAYPGVGSIKELGGLRKNPWKKKLCRIDGALVTLDHIEHDILRPRFKDPRVHFAINCASKGCPPLLSEPYYADRLEQQLDDTTRAFINDPDYNRLEGDRLYVSRIFKWFASDFPNGTVDFFLKYATGDLKVKLETGLGKLKVKYLKYDWSLNEK